MDQLDVPQDAVRWLVVVTPKGLTPQIGPIMADYLKKTVSGTINPNKHFPVFHYPIKSSKVFG